MFMKELYSRTLRILSYFKMRDATLGLIYTRLPPSLRQGSKEKVIIKKRSMYIPGTHLCYRSVAGRRRVAQCDKPNRSRHHKVSVFSRQSIEQKRLSFRHKRYG